jgi:acyl-coenzyme A thioesterase PaaI-like protein
MGEDAGRAARRDAAHGARLLRTWRRLSGLPGGAWLFSRLVGRVAPYTGSVRARVRAVEPGRAEVRLRDRRGVRNHLHSVHAIAIANLGELASGLAVLTAMPRGVRGIPTAIHVAYLKKARGTLTAVGTAVLPAVQETAVAEAAADVVDGAGDTVATVRVEWRLERVEGGP